MSNAIINEATNVLSVTLTWILVQLYGRFFRLLGPVSITRSPFLSLSLSSDQSVPKMLHVQLFFFVVDFVFTSSLCVLCLLSLPTSGKLQASTQWMKRTPTINRSMLYKISLCCHYAHHQVTSSLIYFGQVFEWSTFVRFYALCEWVPFVCMRMCLWVPTAKPNDSRNIVRIVVSFRTGVIRDGRQIRLTTIPWTMGEWAGASGSN